MWFLDLLNLRDQIFGEFQGGYWTMPAIEQEKGFGKDLVTNLVRITSFVLKMATSYILPEKLI